MAHEGHEHRGVDTALRALDLGIAGGALVVLSPGDGRDRARRSASPPGRPVLYRGRRVGRAGRIFTMLKFRTLTPDAEARLGPYLGHELTQRTQTEVTRLGRVLRFAHLDELPQLWNVRARGHEHRRAAPDPAGVLRGAVRARSRSTGSAWWSSRA